ncbi:hypothetical protein GCM10027456_19060 [Kineosporia babensis]
MHLMGLRFVPRDPESGPIYRPDLAHRDDPLRIDGRVVHLPASVGAATDNLPALGPSEEDLAVPRPQIRGNHPGNPHCLRDRNPIASRVRFGQGLP